jgi:hypothetical protein
MYTREPAQLRFPYYTFSSLLASCFQKLHVVSTCDNQSKPAMNYFKL